MFTGALALDHTALAVHSISAALPLYRDLLGGQPTHENVNQEQGFRALQLRYPNGARLELLEPVGPAGFLQDFLARRGEGLHHLTYLVEDLREAVRAARAAGFRVVDESYERPVWHQAFIPPRDAHGTVIQLAATTWSQGEGPRLRHIVEVSRHSATDPNLAHRDSAGSERRPFSSSFGLSRATAGQTPTHGYTSTASRLGTSRRRSASSRWKSASP
jgi:methylmalonyl-CoA/ethylmalonyl-CoA epimerase